MKIGFIGYGNVSAARGARRVAKHGHCSGGRDAGVSFDGRRSVALHCGDDAGPTAKAHAPIEETACEARDLGGPRYARVLEHAAGVVIELLLSGRDPRTVLDLLQPEAKPIG